jgi:hypothetical protein
VRKDTVYIKKKKPTRYKTRSTYLILRKSTGLGSTVSIGIDPDVFCEDLVVRKGKVVVAMSDSRV